MMNLTEGMISKLCNDVNGGTKIVYQGVDIDLSPPWRRASMNDLVRDKIGIDFYEMRGDLEGARAAADKVIDQARSTHMIIGRDNLTTSRLSALHMQCRMCMHRAVTCAVGGMEGEWGL